MSPMSNHLHEIKLTIVIVCVLGIYLFNWYVYHATTVNGKCSPKYPELSVRLYDPEWLPDGGVREGGDGEVYPRGSWWLGDGKVQGCPCSRGKPCLRKCCDQGYIFRPPMNESEPSVCVPSEELSNPELFLDTFDFHTPRKYTRMQSLRNHFQLITEPKCEGVLDYGFQTKDLVILTADGNLLHIKTELSFDQTEFCVEYVEGLNKTALFYCFDFLQNFDKRYELIEVSNGMQHYVMIPVMTVTLIVYSLVPRLRRGYGTPIMCMLLSGILHWIVELIRLHIPYCFTGSGSLKLFLEASENCWSTVVSYYMWLAAGVTPSSKLGSRRFLICCGLAWGAPLLIAVLAEVADRVPGVPNVLKPGLEVPGIPGVWTPGHCFLSTLTARWIYYIGPSVIVRVAKLAISVATLLRLAAGERNAKLLQGTGSRIHNATQINWISLYTKMGFIMGLNSVFVTCIDLFSWVVTIPLVMVYTLYTLRRLGGVEVFLVFVCQWDILRSAVRRLAFWRTC